MVMLCDQLQCTVRSVGASASDLPDLVCLHNKGNIFLYHLLTTSSHHMVSAQHYDALSSASSHFLFDQNFTVVLATPTLFWIAPADDDEFPPSSSAEELYGTMFDEGDEDESPPITYIWGANLERLTIEALVDLANPKLIARFQDDSTASAATDWATDTGAQPNTASTGWSEVDAQWASKGDLDWWRSKDT